MISTDRLILRRPRLEDFEPYQQMWLDPEILRHVAPGPFSGEQMWTRFLRQEGGWQFFGFGYFVIEEKSSGRFVGQMGFQELRREISPSLTGPAGRSRPQRRGAAMPARRRRRHSIGGGNITPGVVSPLSSVRPMWRPSGSSRSWECRCSRRRSITASPSRCSTIFSKAVSARCSGSFYASCVNDGRFSSPGF